MTLLLEKLLNNHGVERFGICAFADCLPLLPCLAQARLPAQPQSVIVCLFACHSGCYPHRNVAHYAVVADYHQVVNGVLQTVCAELQEYFSGEQFAAFADSSPIREVHAASRAGLGVIGTHGLLINEAYGTHLCIGTIVTSMTLAPSTPEASPCLQCDRCVAACPTGALQIGKPLERSLCRSHITQKKGALTPWEQGQIRAGGLVWGCDICADTCPMNKVKAPTIHPAFPGSADPVVTPQNLDRLLADKAYGYRGKAVLLRNLALLEDDE